MKSNGHDIFAWVSGGGIEDMFCTENKEGWASELNKKRTFKKPITKNENKLKLKRTLWNLK